jgi:hypothetical protein
MRIESFEHFGIDSRRLLLLGLSAAVVTAMACAAVAGDALGPATVEVDSVLGALVCYLVVSTPRRVLDSQRVAQARESVPLSVAGAAFLTATGSRSKCMLLLRSKDRELARALTNARRRILLGTPVDESATRASRGLASYSAASVLRSIADLESNISAAGGEESQGLAASSQLSRETKLPIFMTVCFFSPIVLLLYSAFSHISQPGTFAGLVALEVIVLDLAFYLCSSDRRPR